MSHCEKRRSLYVHIHLAPFFLCFAHLIRFLKSLNYILRNKKRRPERAAAFCLCYPKYGVAFVCSELIFSSGLS